jgi:hypothetical protein
MLPFLLSLLVLSHAAPSTWVHPGVMEDNTRLEYIKSMLNTDPIKTAYNKALNSKLANKSYTPEGPPAGGTIECGSYSDPDYGCSAEDSDGSVAYLQLILFYLTNQTVYAQNAVKILNSYGHNLKKYNNSNAPLQAAWGGSKWGRAAELANRLPGVNWAASDVTAFKNMLNTVIIPLIYDGSGSNGNWELSMIEAMMAISVFTENATLFDHAVTFWKQRVPSYFYCDSIDKGKPVPAPRGTANWYGQTVFNASTTGHCQETCRDEGHTTYGLAATLNAAETAYIQGTDLYAPNAARLTQGMEYNAYWLQGNKPPSYVCGGTVDISSQYPSYEVGYNAFVNRNTYSLPNSLQHITQKVRTNNDPYDWHMIIYETLTHGGSPK